jgi:hypothetical protein
VKYLLPVIVIKLKNVRPQEWTAAVHDKLYSSVESMSIIEAKIKFLSNDNHNLLFSMHCICLDLIQTWPLFGTTFFTVDVCIRF